MSHLNKNSVLVLNRNWQAINTTTPANAFCQMMTDVVTALDISGDDEMRPLRWEDWRDLPVRDEESSIGTPQGQIRVPTVVVCSNFDRVPMTRPKFSFRSIWLRDQGCCQYSGKPLCREEGNIDHVIPRSRGGKTDWENCVLASKRINTRKADRTPQEAGLSLLRTPRAPRPVPVTVMLRNTFQIPDWEPFMIA